MSNEADGMLHLLKAEPTLLPEAPTDTTVAQMEHRRLDEVHACLRCGDQARNAYIADTKLGNRWLDLCHACAHWLRTTMTDRPH